MPDNKLLSRNPAILSQSVWIFLLLLMFWMSAFISWQILSKADFFYSFWYQAISIDEHIDRYAVQNYNKDGFELTSDAERARLFGDIVRAINSDGKGLSAIVYKTGMAEEALLTNAEIIHLKDVAHLIGVFKFSGLVAFLLFTLLLVVVLKLNLGRPFLFRILAWFMLGLMLMVGAVILIGSRKIFYRLHTLVFPDDHQWFFYYQESLMSTMMKAPDLFACIGINWLFFSLLIMLFFYGLTVRAFSLKDSF